MSDLIRLEDVIEILEGITWFHRNKNGKLVEGSRSDLESFIKFEEVEEKIQSIPAVDAVEVKHGRWEEDMLDGLPGYRPIVIVCSNCHRVSPSGFPFCPNCGAKMDKEDEI